MAALIDFDPVREEFLASVSEALDEGTEGAADEAVQGASRRSGELAESIGWDGEDSPPLFRRRLYASAEHASYQDQGTGIYGPHGTPIVPTTPLTRGPNGRAKGGVLTFFWDAAGAYVFARSVRGSEPTRFFEKAEEGWWARVERSLHDRVG